MRISVDATIPQEKLIGTGNSRRQIQAFNQSRKDLNKTIEFILALAPPEGFEPPWYNLEGCCLIHSATAGS